METVEEQLHYDTADRAIIVRHERVTLGHNRGDNYILTQQTRQVH